MTKLTIEQFFEEFSKQNEQFLKENPTYIPMTNAPFFSGDISTFVPILKEKNND